MNYEVRFTETSRGRGQASKAAEVVVSFRTVVAAAAAVHGLAGDVSHNKSDVYFEIGGMKWRGTREDSGVYFRPTEQVPGRDEWEEAAGALVAALEGIVVAQEPLACVVQDMHSDARDLHNSVGQAWEHLRKVEILAEQADAKAGATVQEVERIDKLLEHLIGALEQSGVYKRDGEELSF